MREASFPAKPTREERFDRAGRSGVVRAYYGVTGAPSDSGFSALPGWARARRAGVGFPTLKCEVESSRPGYLGCLGWIQWVTQEYRDGRPAVRLVDRVPSLLDRDVPFLAFGYAPSFFDAPAYNSLPAVDWRATAYLCTAPILSRKEVVRPLVGFRWGYGIDRAGTEPVPYPLELATQEDWRTVRPELSERHPAWKFGGPPEDPRPSRSHR